MSKRSLAPYIALLFLAAMATPAASQRPPSFFAEGSVGVGFSGGGDYDHRPGQAADLMLGMRLSDTAAGTAVGALIAGLNGPMGIDLVCRRLPGAECAPAFPLVLSGGALFGLERRSAGGAAGRVLAGPSYNSFVEGAEALGIQGRLDLATPPVARTAVVASLRSILLPSFQGETLRLTSFGIGLRIQ